MRSGQRPPQGDRSSKPVTHEAMRGQTEAISRISPDTLALLDPRNDLLIRLSWVQVPPPGAESALVLQGVPPPALFACTHGARMGRETLHAGLS